MEKIRQTARPAHKADTASSQEDYAGFLSVRGESVPGTSAGAATLIHTCYMLALLSWAVSLCLCGCRKMPETGAMPPAAPKSSCLLRLEAPAGTAEDSVDVFAYNPDNDDRIDSYSRIPLRQTAELTLTTGRKRLVVLAGMDVSALTYADISTFESLGRVCARLEKEHPQRPILSGTVETEPGVRPQAALTLEALMTRIHIASLRADFSGQPYAGAVLDSVRIYLTNVCCTCPLLEQERHPSLQFCNYGRLDEEELQRFAQPSMLLWDVPGQIGADARPVDALLYCYPNREAQEGPGTPFTRLVIECVILGERFYYPFNLGRTAGFGAGVVRNRTYRLDITLRRLGSRDPDTVVEPQDVGILLQREDWKEMEKKYEDF